MIKKKGLFVISPHCDGGMLLPAILRVKKSFKDLKILNTLFV